MCIAILECVDLFTFQMSMAMVNKTQKTKSVLWRYFLLWSDFGAHMFHNVKRERKLQLNFPIINFISIPTQQFDRMFDCANLIK